jgi:CMP-N-acetylneuraminic acid synthetase
MIIFIPIKENSQRVPRKNFRDFGGEPLYKHTLLKYVEDEVYVDTDSDEIMSEIKKDSRLSNVVAYERNKNLIGDKVSVCSLVADFINRFKIRNAIAQIHVTSPFLERRLITNAHSLIGDYDSVVSCNVYNSRFWRKEEYGYCPVNHNPVKMEQTQDLPKMYEENSAFYIFKPGVLGYTNSRVGKNPYFYEVLFPHSLDIDNEKDWTMALKMKGNKDRIDSDLIGET